MSKLLQSEPYKLLFPVGALCSAVGVSQWILFYFNWLPEYPIKVHSQLMILGFLFSFVLGFLMTAIPRMTNTHSATKLEKAFASIVVIVFLVFTILGLDKLSFIISMSLFLFLMVYLLRRIVSIESNVLPPGFIFIPFGLTSGLIGTLLTFLSNYGFIELLGIGKLLLYEGFILNLIIGLGSRLIPVLTRKSEALSPAKTNTLSNKIFLLEVLIFNGSLFLEAFFSMQMGVALRSLIMGFILYKNFHFFKPTVEKSKLGHGILIASASLPLSYFLIFIFPLYRAHIIHILYISGFVLLALLVSVRVSLAHGGASLDLEKSSSFIPILVAVLLMASLVRVLGFVFGGIYTAGLYASAGLFFLVGLLIWRSLLQKM
ncbi:MAG: NnrS family protein [Oligoflexia bacterium]|nr:NnrS family protein [Oligoflexia bacterium]